ncbi:chromosome segregation protein SMC [Acidisoma sp.]|uniref:chromosome segregation protein SMC n=1 Tax=Acidisoma sp. TaxID=1872115 RepID=UPI003B00EE59
MAARLARLRIAGFKSFADTTSLDILPGLTGIIGPNGCGKSNIVEALRWAMGEGSARSLRGGEMDDIIFAGTTGRPSRNIAEVTVTLEEAAGIVPPPHHEQSELEITRKIERGAGSNYRVNGREVRARDVQTLFADLASGARSCAMVGQGRVAAIVGAKPEERRQILEEAAGISGLSARRHEAELKLRATEANLQRAEDLRGQVEAQLQGLQRQARQAARYRNISGLIRAAEAEFLAIQYARTERNRAGAHAALAAARSAVAEAAQAVRAAEQSHGGSDGIVPPLRAAEADARTALERQRVAAEQLAGEEARARAAIGAATQRLEQAKRDLDRARAMMRDAAEAEQRLGAEDATLAAAETESAGRLTAALAAMNQAAEAARAAEAASQQAVERNAGLAAQSQALTQRLTQAEQRTRRLAEQVTRLIADRDRLAADLVSPEKMEEARAAVAAAEAARQDAATRMETAERGRVAAQAALAAARDRANTTEASATKLRAEIRALSEVLSVGGSQTGPEMVDVLTVPAGLEAALGAALGEELSASTDADAARHWRELPSLEGGTTLPGGCTPLNSLVQGPPALARTLSQIAVAPAEAAPDLQAQLRPGQTIVSEAGGVWRWDGYTIRAGTPTPATVRLTQRNRLRKLRDEGARADAAAAAARAVQEAAQAADRAGLAEEQAARNARRDAEQAAERLRQTATALAARAAAAEARLSGVAAQLATAEPERTEAEAALTAVRAEAIALPDLTAMRAEVEATRAALGLARREESESRTRHDGLVRDIAARTQRRQALARERESWAERAESASAHIADLEQRQTEAAAEHAAVVAIPERLAGERAAQAALLAEAETAHRNAAARLSQAETEARAAERASRAAETAQVLAREAMLRAEGAVAQADHAWGTVAERVLERLGANPEFPEIADEPTVEAEEKARRRFDRLTKERDEMGPVNLRAEIEAEELSRQIALIDGEKGDLVAAIAKLRGSVGHLNREGRERLATVFTEIDKHFQALYTRMFGGGRAHLALVGSDDPLEAGLEIYAQPPGKKLATLSLLSGGEQALTALSLIFAVFRCNPAPLAVLDEVDAPLDDANVERLCTLLNDVVRETGTRFLVVTHHHHTMARMDRLYGVTMMERGVSRLLSVDLHRAVAMTENAPRMAAE